MQADKGKFAEVMVKEDFFSPSQLIVAPLTPLPFLALMHIILLVTAIAGRLQFLLVERPFVARIAVDLTVFAFEGKRSLIVVEDGTFPVLWRMARFALLSVTATMDVIQLVT